MSRNNNICGYCGINLRANGPSGMYHSWCYLLLCLQWSLDGVSHPSRISDLADLSWSRLHDSKSNGAGDMTWEQSWIEGVPPGHDVMTNPTCPQPGFTLPRRQFVTLNCLACGQARCFESLYRWGVIASPACPCGESIQTTRHTVEECPLTAFPGSLRCLHETGPDAVEWLSKLSMKLWECSKRTTTTLDGASTCFCVCNGH